jgi:hypothetical protein
MKQRILNSPLYLGVFFGMLGAISLIISDLNVGVGRIMILPIGVLLILSVLFLQDKKMWSLFKVCFITYSTIFLVFLSYALFYQGRLLYGIFSIEFLKVFLLNLLCAFMVSSVLTLLACLMYKLRGTLKY